MNRGTKIRIADIVLSPLIYPAGRLLKWIRMVGVANMPRCKQALMKVGVFPIWNHYYEPLFDSRILDRPLDMERNLPGIDWNISAQLRILESFDFADELKEIPRSKVGDGHFYMDNGSFISGDAEYLYNLIRLKKPARLFEIGSGFSTLMARKAIIKNMEEIPGYQCKHLCIEPYEAPWLEAVGVTVIRQKVEEVGTSVFSELASGDLLFIDSSHMIRPQGDVLFEYLELLPSLKTGVIVHVHDIFSPKDYLKEWVVDDVKFWNEQYLLEAFLTCNRDWKVIGALNYLHHNHYDLLRSKCPFLTRDREPGSFYIEKVA
jgi:predicted O-methyltransferase YrrM